MENEPPPLNYTAQLAADLARQADPVDALATDYRMAALVYPGRSTAAIVRNLAKVHGQPRDQIERLLYAARQRRLIGPLVYPTPETARAALNATEGTAMFAVLVGEIYTDLAERNPSTVITDLAELLGLSREQVEGHVRLARLGGQLPPVDTPPPARAAPAQPALPLGLPDATRRDQALNIALGHGWIVLDGDSTTTTEGRPGRRFAVARPGGQVTWVSPADSELLTFLWALACAHGEPYALTYRPGQHPDVDMADTSG